MAKFAVRYGSEMRKLHDAVIRQKRKHYPCPKCDKKNVRRTGTSLWICRSCGAKFAGGAYSLRTPVGESIHGMIANIKKGILAAKT